MDTTGWVSASAILDTNITQRFGNLSDEDLRVHRDGKLAESALVDGVGERPLVHPRRPGPQP
eukprot:4718435-Alexandrium_andersonii.AAC.1